MVRGDTAAEDGQIEDATAASKGLIDCFQVGSIHPYSCNCPGVVQERERERETERKRDRERHCDSVCVCVCVCFRPRAHAKSEIDTCTKAMAKALTKELKTQSKKVRKAGGCVGCSSPWTDVARRGPSLNSSTRET